MPWLTMTALGLKISQKLNSWIGLFIFVSIPWGFVLWYAIPDHNGANMIIEPTIDTLIEKNPNLRGGRPIVAGTGTTVRSIAGLYKLGMSAEEIAVQLPHLNLAQIYAALAYYHLNSEEIEADIEADSEENLKQLTQ